MRNAGTFRDAVNRFDAFANEHLIRENKDFVFLGAAATREVGDRLELGVETSHQTGEERGQGASTHVGVGGAYKVSEKWSLLASGGPDFGHGAEHGQFTFYVGIAFAN